MSNTGKIAFIICTNSEMWFEECQKYIQLLEIPQGYEVEVLAIQDAKSMPAGYNEGMKATDACIKIYMHQDVFILNRFFLVDLLQIFHSDEKIGMIGLVGTKKLAADGMMWHAQREGALYAFTPVEVSYSRYRYDLSDGYEEMSAIDGLMMATSRDIVWREDLLSGWDFYDVVQSFEFRKAGYKVVVPNQKTPWAYHDDGMMNLWNYDENRRKIIENYREMF